MPSTKSDAADRANQSFIRFEWDDVRDWQSDASLGSARHGLLVLWRSASKRCAIGNRAAANPTGRRLRCSRLRRAIQESSGNLVSAA
jgi:hypothetical protein